MASNQTAKLGLSLWNGTDYVLREDFNRDNNKLEAAYRQLPHIVSGSYTGDGTFGPDHPTSITCSIKPCLVVITADASIPKLLHT